MQAGQIICSPDLLMPPGLLYMPLAKSSRSYKVSGNLDGLRNRTDRRRQRGGCRYRTARHSIGGAQGRQVMAWLIWATSVVLAWRQDLAPGAACVASEITIAARRSRKT